MKWYLAKLVYRIVCGNGDHIPQFDEQLRLIAAEDDLHAFQKARLMGEREQDSFLNHHLKLVQWSFIDVAELHKLDSLMDGAEMYSRICEEENPDLYIRTTKLRANHLFEYSMHRSIPLN